MRLEIAGNAKPRHRADARRDHLRHRHQRIAEQHHPAELIAELCAGLAVGGDAARVVIRSPGDQAGAKRLEQAGFVCGRGGHMERLLVIDRSILESRAIG